MNTTPRLTALALAATAAALAACSDAPDATGPVRAAAAPPRAALVGIPVTTITITDLGTLGIDANGNEYSEANAVSDSDVVVGTTTKAGATNLRVFRWTQGGGMQTVGINGEGADVNLSGQIAGTHYNAGYTLDEAFRRLANGTYIALGSLGCCGSVTQGFGINDAGYVVGMAGQYSVKHAFVYSPWSGTLTDLGAAASPFTGSEARAINNSNVIVGSDFESGSWPDAKAWKRPVGGAKSYLDQMGSAQTYAYDINDGGVIAGKMLLPAVYPAEHHAVRWVSGVGEDLGTAGEQSEARGVNKHGYVVGTAGYGSGADAVLWKPSGTRVSLPGLTATSASHAFGVNKRLWVVGTSTTGGQTHAVLWTVKFTYVVLTDVQPGLYDSVIHLGAAGHLPVALLASREVDVREIDPAVLTLGDGRGTETPIARHPDGRPMASYEDVDKDGDLDLVAYYDQSHLERNQDLTSATTQLVLSGDLGDGRHVRGTDRVAVR